MSRTFADKGFEYMLRRGGMSGSRDIYGVSRPVLVRAPEYTKTTFWDQGQQCWSAGVPISTDTDSTPDTGYVQLMTRVWPNTLRDYKIALTSNYVRVAVPRQFDARQVAEILNYIETYGPAAAQYEYVYNTLVPMILTPTEKMSAPFIAG